jgi:hypothetical protein
VACLGAASPAHAAAVAQPAASCTIAAYESGKDEPDAPAQRWRVEMGEGPGKNELLDIVGLTEAYARATGQIGDHPVDRHWARELRDAAGEPVSQRSVTWMRPNEYVLTLAADAHGALPHAPLASPSTRTRLHRVTGRAHAQATAAST